MGGVTIVKLGGPVIPVTNTTTSHVQSYVSPVSTVSQNSPPTATHVGYTRRAKLGDSRSTGRLHTPSNTHRSMTRLNIAGLINYLNFIIKQLITFLKITTSES